MERLHDTTVGLKTFYRTDKLEMTLKSLVGLGFKKVIVADDGPNDFQKDKIYETMKELLPLEVLKLPYDAGLGYGRAKIVEKCKTKYLLIIDDDMVVPKNISMLKEILKNDKSLGGVAGIWNEYGRLRGGGGHNLLYRQGYVIRYVPEKIEVKGDIPYIYFDFIANSALFRRRALKDYSWDENYVINFEHLDFYWGHKQLGRWKFAVTPAVIFKHYPGGNVRYKKFRFNKERYRRSKEYFLRKWNLKGVINIQTDFLMREPSLKSFIWLWVKKHAPFKLLPYMIWIEEKVVS